MKIDLTRDDPLADEARHRERAQREGFVTAQDLTREQLRAVRAVCDYANMGFEQMNSAMRHGRSLTSKGRYLREQLLRFADRSVADRVSDARPLWRGLVMPSDMIEAGSWIDPGFVSTSWSKYEARRFSEIEDNRQEAVAAGTAERVLLKIVGFDGPAVDIERLMHEHQLLMHPSMPWLAREEQEALLVPNIEFAVESRRTIKPSARQSVSELTVIAIHHEETT